MFAALNTLNASSLQASMILECFAKDFSTIVSYENLGKCCPISVIIELITTTLICIFFSFLSSLDKEFIVATSIMTLSNVTYFVRSS